MFNMLKRSGSLSVIIALLSVVFYSCSTDTMYHENVMLPSEGWDKNQPIVFNINIIDIEVIDLKFENSDHNPIYLKIQLLP